MTATTLKLATAHTTTRPGTGLLSTLAVWHQRARARRQLAEMPAHRLEDIGLSRGDARSEARKPFWMA